MGLDVLLVSGIWPPAVGGPASHMPEVGRFLLQHGHRIRAVTASTGPVDVAPFPVRVIRQDRPRPSRMLLGTRVLSRSARTADVIYASGFYSRSAAASLFTGAPLVVKLVNDPAYERARSTRVFSGTLEDFQRNQGDVRIVALKLLRTWSLRRAARIIVPSRYLAEIVRAWNEGITDPIIVPNPRPHLSATASREALRRRFSLERFTAVFAGRFAAQKRLSLSLQALARTRCCDLVLVGDGPDRTAVEGEICRLRLTSRVRVVGAMPRQAVLDWLCAADVALLSSDWENHPHTVVEALSVGTPVVATAVGGVPELVRDGDNGILVPPGDTVALASALQWCADNKEFVEQLREGAASTVASIDSETAFCRLEHHLVEAARRGPLSSPCPNNAPAAPNAGSKPGEQRTGGGNHALGEL